MEVKVPAGVETGSRLRITGEGEGGASGGGAGDLYVVIHVKEHEQFERQGSNLYAAVPVTFAQGSAGTVRGDVKDPNGAVVPSATVTLIDEQTGSTRTTTTPP